MIRSHFSYVTQRDRCCLWKISAYIITFQNRTHMKGYRYASPLTISKQNSQSNSPLPAQTNSHLILKASISDRSNLDLRGSNGLSLRSSLNQGALSKDVSIQLLSEFQGNKGDSALGGNSLKLGNESEISSVEIQRGSLSLRNEGAMLEDSRVGSMISSNVIVHKLGEKIKTKTQLLRCSSKPMEINMENSLKLPNLRTFESTIESEKSQLTKPESLMEWVNCEISKLTQRMTKNEEKMQKIEKACKKTESTNPSDSFINPQFQEINKILSLVQKAENRDDYRKTMKMIDQLRSNILELHVQLKNVRVDNQVCSKVQVNSNQQQWLRTIQDECKNLGNNFQQEILKLNKKIEQIQQHHKAVKLPLAEKDQRSNISSQRCEGKMVTFIYEERISLPSSNQLALQSPNKPKSQSTDSSNEKENNQMAILTSTIYHIDSEGYLLDRNRYYILNKNSEQIKLTTREIELLKKHSIL